MTNSRAIFELSAVFLTAIGKFVLVDYMGWRFPFTFGVCTFWIAYLLYQACFHPKLLKHWGFRTDNLNAVIREVLPFGILAMALMFLTGYILGALNLNWHIFPILFTYPIWGIIQQYLLIALVAGNLNEMDSISWNQNVIIVVTSVLFSVVHYPDLWLMIGTFPLALYYGYIYLQNRNLYVLGTFHGWLGAFFYYTVVGRDPFLETFGPYLEGL